MESVSSRHEGDLRGSLRTFDPSQAVTVEVAIDPDLADTPAVQHTAWMLINLLARGEGIVDRIQLHCPAKTEVQPRVVPFGVATTFATRLVEAGSSVGVVPVSDDIGPVDRVIVIGRRHPTRSIEATDLVALGAGWWGGITFGTSSAPAGLMSVDVARSEPFGPYIAACLAAADVFLRIRDPRRIDATVGRHGWNAWTAHSEPAPSQLGPVVNNVALDSVGLAGVGAVGAAWMHTIWATPSVTGRVMAVDADKEGVSTSNLNRGLLFRREDLGHEKAATAAAAAAGGVDWTPVQGRFEDQHPRPSLLISAVDTNTARDALQATYPAQTLSASTEDLRAEVSVAGTPGIGACLRCFNPPERVVSDAELRDRARQADPSLAQGLAWAIGTDFADIQRRLTTPGCDAISDRMLAQLRNHYGDDAAPARFAVGFASAMAGVLLAVETLRLYIDPSSRPTGATARTTFQFHRPDSPHNSTRPYLRDLGCPKCAPGSAALAPWHTKHENWSSSAPSLR